MTTVEFKSNQSNFWKEKYGLKPNTIRKIDMKDIRFKGLLNGSVDEIIIKHDISEKGFYRKIKDVTVWEDFAIISWEHEIDNEK